MLYRVCAIALIVNSLFFFRGCSALHGSRFSLGFVAHTADVATTEVGMALFPDRVLSVSLVYLVPNLAAGMLFGIMVLRLRERRRAWISLFASAGLINCFMLSIHVWAYIVCLPSEWISIGTRWLLFLGRPAKGMDPRFSQSIASRIWFLALFALLYGGSSLIARLRASHRDWPDPDRTTGVGGT